MLRGKWRKIAVIGVGKMGDTLVDRLLASDLVAREDLAGSTAHQDSVERVAARHGIATYLDNAEMVRDREIILLAVEPQMVAGVLDEIADVLSEDQWIISIAAAIRTRFIEDRLKIQIPVVRAMPNTPMLVNAGMTVLCSGRYANATHLEIAREIFGAVGLVETIDREELMDAVTGLSGSGPAYTYIIIESLAEAGVKVGLPRSLATTLSAQAVLGGAKLVLETGEHPAKLKDEVTTPAGITVDGLMELEEGGLRVTLIKAVTRATEKSQEISR
ncbi:MAG: pyrroline-5-carboxylate reductase [Candidatus Bipolaricaulia bacterium]